MSLRRLAVMVVLVIGMSVFLRPVPTVAQTSNPACPALVELALSQVGNNCADLGHNSACYGFNKLTATFNQSVDPKTFTRPSDRGDLATFQTIQTAALDLGLGQWGIAVLNVQANVPETLPGQAVTFLLLGDSDIENAVATSDTSVSAVTVILQAATDLRSSADAASAVTGQLAAGTVVDANAISEDGSAIRLKTDNGGGWVDRSAVNTNSSLDKLPKVKANSDSPMQSFYFRTRPGGNLDCSQTPSVLTIQSPQHIKVNLTANGADIEMGSLITLQVLPDGVTMQLTTLEGDATVGKGTPDEVDIPAGSTSTHCLSAPQNLGDDGKANDQTLGTNCKWTQPRSATVSELEEGQTAQAILDRLGLTRTDLVVTPEPTAVATAAAPQPTAVPTAQITPVSVPVDCPVGSNITHVVSAGENLYRISVRYHTSMGAIMAANGITDANRIFSGQRLIIPCGVDTGIPSVPQQPQVPIVIPNNGQRPPGPPTFPTGVDCSRFRATSPLDGLNYGYNVFYWDGAPGATSYRINVYGIDESKGALVRSFDSAGAATSLTADITNETTGFGYKFAWEVQALSNGAVACISNRTTMPRGSRPDSGQPNAGVAPTPGSPFTATWNCLGTTNNYIVNYSGAPAGTTGVTVTYRVTAGGVSPSPAVGTAPGTSGSVTINSTSRGAITAGNIVANPSATTLALPGSLTC